MNEKAGKFMIGFAACATSLLVPRGMAELANFGDAQTINLFKTEYLLLCSLISVCMAVSVMLYYWHRTTTPAVIFSGTLALFATISGGLTASGLSGDLRQANARLVQLGEEVVNDIGVPIQLSSAAESMPPSYAGFSLVNAALAQGDRTAQSNRPFGASNLQEYLLVLDQTHNEQDAIELQERWQQVAPNATLSETDDGTIRVLQQATPAPLDLIAEDLLRLRPEITGFGLTLDSAVIAPAQ